jgi:hypothetical protein
MSNTMSDRISNTMRTGVDNAISLSQSSFSMTVCLCEIGARELDSTIMESPEYSSMSTAMDAFYLRMCMIGSLLENYSTLLTADIAALKEAGAALEQTDSSLAAQIAG